MKELLSLYSCFDTGSGLYFAMFYSHLIQFQSDKIGNTPIPFGVVVWMSMHYALCMSPSISAS